MKRFRRTAVLVVFAALLVVLGSLGLAGGAVASTAAYQRAVLGDSPDLFWQLNDSGCCTAVDSSGSGDAGTYESYPGVVTYGTPGAMSGAGNSAITVDGAAAPVSASSFGLPAGNSSRSVELWFKTTQSGVQSLFAYGAQRANEMFSLVLDYHQGQLVFTNWTGNFYFPAPADTTNGAWHQVVLTYTSSTDELALYLDGSEIGETDWDTVRGSGLDTVVDSSAASSTDGVEVGKMPVDAGLHWSLQDFSVYSSALSAPQVQAHYDAALSAAQQTLAHGASVFWPLDDPGCCTAVDASGNDFYGTYTSGLTYGVQGESGTAIDTSSAIGANSSVVPVGASASVGLPSGNSSRSVELWFKTTVGGAQSLFSYGSAQANETFALVLNYPAGYFAFTQHGSNSFFRIPGDVADGTWHQVVLTWNSSTEALTLYLDGTRLATNGWGSSLATATLGPVDVGATPFGDPAPDSRLCRNPSLRLLSNQSQSCCDVRLWDV